MPLKQCLQKDYTLSSLYYQIKLPLDLEILIPADDPVRLLSAFVEGMELSDLYKTYGKIKKNQATPKQLFKIIIYASMNRIYSSRDIETACRRDVNFMYLLEGNPAPDHATIARFISLHFSKCSKKILAEVAAMLYELGEISGEYIFIDGTKIESAANKYTFVWKKAVTKHQAKLFHKIAILVEECEKLYGLRIVHNRQISLHTLKRLRKKLYKIKKAEGIEFVHGIGKRKSSLQKSMESLEACIDKLKEYTKKIYVCGDRNSYAKTDPDATFMRMKEDAMMNGQLKPAYNLQHGVDSEYVIWLDISSRPTDTRTLIPFLKDMEENLPFKYLDIVADAGYESEENYLFIKENGQVSYIKPANYEISKTRKYKQDISRMENMDYDEANDCYYCKNGKTLTAQYEKQEKTTSGYQRTVTVYQCCDCAGCPYKIACIKGNHCKTPMAERQKVLYRSIQAEGSFANIKEDMEFRRYLYRGKENVTAQSVILAIGYDINKLHHKIQSERTGQHLFPLRKTA